MDLLRLFILNFYIQEESVKTSQNTPTSCLIAVYSY